MSNVKIDPEVADILSRATIGSDILVLPPEQLERKLYEKVAKVIKLAGGVWKTNKKGFLFNSDPREKLGLALDSGVIVDEKKKRQAFYTPMAIANEVADIAYVSGMAVLEPSAGDGNLVEACLRAGAISVDCIEIEKSCKEKLEGPKRKVTIGDFMTIEPYDKFDRIVMNPPFTKGQYHKHIARALEWLYDGGRLYAIVPDTICLKLAALGAYDVRSFDAGAFKESGTNVRTKLICIEK